MENNITSGVTTVDLTMPDYSDEYTPVTITSPYQLPQETNTQFQNGSIAPQSINFADLNYLDIPSGESLHQVISANDSETDITDATGTLNLSQECMVLTLATVTYQMVQGATGDFYGEGAFFINIDGEDDLGEAVITGGELSGLVVGAGNLSTVSFHSITRLSPASHTIKLTGLLNYDINTPNLKIIGYRLTIIPFAN